MKSNLRETALLGSSHQNVEPRNTPKTSMDAMRFHHPVLLR
jgi:hypothetical protein